MANKRKTAAQKQRAKARQQRAASANASGNGPASPEQQAGSRPKRPAQRRPPARRRKSSGMSWGAIGAVVVVVAVMAVIFATRKSSPSGGGGSQTAIAKVTSVSASTLEKIGVPSDVQLVPSLPSGTPPVQSGDKPVVTYVGAEYCPYCAAERWPFVVALSRFGTFSNLGTTTSAPKPEPFPETPTLSFHGSSYTSDYLVLSAVETQTNKPDATTGGWTPLDTPTDQQQQLISTYDTQQYTGSDGGIPFIMIGNLYAWAGATYDAAVLGGLSFDQIANQLDNPDSKVAQGIDGAANQITAMICKLTGNQPSDVCTAPSIQQAQAALPTP
jgi:hypothetical protein